MGLDLLEITEHFELPSPPAVAIRILEAVKKDDSATEELSKIISADPALTAKVLRIANSPLYAMPSKVESVKKAVTILGTRALRNSALSFIIVEETSRYRQGALDLKEFWRQSIIAAVAAEELSRRLRINDEDLFVSSLLQNIGGLVLSSAFPDQYSHIVNGLSGGEESLHELEASTFGFDHQTVSYELLKKWGLPPNIYEPVRFHHNLAAAPPSIAQKTEALFLADMLACSFCGTNGVRGLSSFVGILTARHGMTAQQVADFVDAIQDRVQEVLSFFEIDSHAMKSVGKILLEANKELEKLNVSYQQLAMELQQAKEKAELLANELREANTRLTQMAYKDSLTDLYNHRYFQEILEKEMSRGIRNGKAMSLMLFDLDHFKRVNDQYGHPIGDKVLKQVALLANASVRKCDSVARYGGEEFAVILPETDARGAAVVAERLRQNVAQMQFLIGGKRLQVTISIGLASWIPAGRDSQTKSEIIQAADQALYESKKAGRNKVTISRSSLPGP